MEDLISQIDCGSKSDSIVMRILRSAMDKAHEKLQFKDGPMESLHERTTFYELAAILVEGGLNIVQEESDEILENSCNKIPSDLMGIRQWLVGRIRAMKQLIMEKDREFRERLENETKLREALELKERESVHLYEKIEAAGLMKNEGDVSTLKNSVDEQVLNIKQKMILNTSSPNLSLDFLDKERGLVMFEDDDFGIKLQSELRSINILKRTLDLTEVLQLEKQWRRTIERDVESVLVKGFERDVQTRFDIELKKRVGLVKDSWFDFIDEMRNLFHELKDFFLRNDVLEKGSNVQSCSARSRRTNSEPNLDVNFTENDPLEDDGDEVGGSPHVWKIIKSYESIIRWQREQRSLLTRDALKRESSSSWLKRNEDINAMDRRIQDAITRLENFTQRNHKVSDLKGVGGRNRAQEKRRRIPKSHRRIDGASTTIQSFEAEIKKLQEERDGLCFQISVTEDTYQLLFRGVMKDFSAGLCCGGSSTVKIGEKEQETATDESKGSSSYQILLHYMESTIREDIYVVVFQETVEQWKMSRSDSARRSETPPEDFRCSPILRDYSESLVREDIYLVIFQEMVKQWKMNQYDLVRGSETPPEDFRCSPILRDYTESLMREDIYVVVFQEMVKQWKASQSDSVRGSKTPSEDFQCSPILRECTESLLREYIYMIVFQEMVKQWKTSQSDSVRGSKTPQEDFCCSPILRDCTESLLREEIYEIYFREMTKEWRSEELKQFDFGARRPHSRRSKTETTSQGEGDGESSLSQKLDSLLKCMEAEEDLIQKASSLIKEHSVSNSLMILNCEEMDKRNAVEWLITDDEGTFCTVSENLEGALQQLYTSKELLAELEESLEASDGVGEYYDGAQIDNSFSTELDGRDGQIDLSENVLAIIKRFRFLVNNVDVVLHENLESKCLRLEALKHQVDELNQPVAWIRTRKLLYKKAFISRCRNLKLAEIEVDLLGDQVETLVYLLERIYLVLNQNATVLSGYFEVYDILKLIKIELNGGRSSKNKS